MVGIHLQGEIIGRFSKENRAAIFSRMYVCSSFDGIEEFIERFRIARETNQTEILLVFCQLNTCFSA